MGRASPVRLALLLALSQAGEAMRLLVLGGSGYVGRQVCREAIQRGWAVTSLSRRGENPCPGTELDRVRWVKGNAADEQLLLSLIHI